MLVVERGIAERERERERGEVGRGPCMFVFLILHVYFPGAMQVFDEGVSRVTCVRRLQGDCPCIVQIKFGRSPVAMQPLWKLLCLLQLVASSNTQADFVMRRSASTAFDFLLESPHGKKSSKPDSKGLCFHNQDSMEMWPSVLVDMMWNGFWTAMFA